MIVRWSEICFFCFFFSCWQCCECWCSERSTEVSPVLPDSLPAPDLSHLRRSCPSKCNCSLTSTSLHLKVNCSGPFHRDFPLNSIPRGVQILHVEPCDSCQSNVIHMGPEFGELRLLRILRIRHGSVPNLGSGSLLGLSALRELDLRHNNLSRIVDANFEGLWTLEELYLDNNLISSMISAGFRHAANLQVLSLRCNNVSELAPRLFLKLSRLRHLDLSGNPLRSIDGAVFVDTPNLETLTCQHCKLRTVTMPDMYSQRHLSSLDLSFNEIESLEEGVHVNFLRHLRRLGLHHNRIGQRVLIGNRLKNLNSLQLQHNSIEEVHFVGRHPKLRHLDLSHNNLQDVHLRFHLGALETLRLSGNALTGVVVGVMAKLMPNLTHLHLDRIGLMAWPHTLLKHNERLQWLNMSGNFLVDVQSDSLEMLRELRMLDLSHNFMMGLNERLLRLVHSRSNLNMLYLQGNPWSCDRCHVRPLLSFLKRSLMYWGTCDESFMSTSMSQLSHLCLRCTSPSILKERAIINLTDSDLPQCSTTASLSPKLIRMETRREKSFFVPWDTNSPLIVLSVALMLLLILILLITISVGSAYRHYGVYFTREAERRAARRALNNDHDDDVVVIGHVDTNNEELDVVQVLDTSQESYINLKFNNATSIPNALNQH